MSLATFDFGDLFIYSRNSTKWEMGPNGKFIEYPIGEPAYRHDISTGECLGFSVNEPVTTLNQSSLFSYSSGNFNTVDAASLFEGKVAKRVANVVSSPSAGAAYPVGPLPSRGATYVLIVELLSTARVMFGFRDSDAPLWEAGFSFSTATETLMREQGSNTDLTLGARKLTGVGPNGGPVYELRMTLLSQTNAGNNLTGQHYPAYESDAFTDPRESIVHYAGITDSPYYSPPIWIDGSNVTRARDYCFIAPLLGANEYPRTLYLELVADDGAVGVSDSFHGGCGFINSDGSTISDRAWAGYRGAGTAVNAQVVTPAVSTSQMGSTFVPFGQVLKACLGWNDQIVAFCANGTYETQSSAAGIPGKNRRRLQVGHAITPSRTLNGLVKKIRVANELWSQEKMIAETTG
ncbi:hypothetical protein ACEK07_04345 [Alcanivoracaceae bacterium MT1]